MAKAASKAKTKTSKKKKRSLPDIKSLTDVKALFSRLKRADLPDILLLIFCFPLGLQRMWTRGLWTRRTRWVVTGVIGLVVFLILAPFTDPPTRQTGGITVIDTAVEDDTQGPVAPENRTAVDIYVPQRTAMIIEATPTPEPTIVYCNDGGQYYHVKGCKWVKPTTPSVTLSQAVNAGFTQCPDCDAPAPAVD